MGIKDKDSYEEHLNVSDFKRIINTDVVLITKTEIEYCYI